MHARATRVIAYVTVSPMLSYNIVHFITLADLQAF